jgi:hypothetical protein
VSAHDPDDLAEQFEAVVGRKAPWTIVPDWITLHDDLEPQAKAVYGVLAMHVNVQAKDDAAWPSRKMIAEMLGWSREQSPDKYIKQLEAAGAIDTEPMTRPNGAKGKRYIVHQTPPPGYTGPTTVAEWYRRRREALATSGPAPTPGRPRRAAAAVKTSEQPKVAKKAAQARKTATPKPRKKTPEEELLDQRADKGAHLWWDEIAPALVDAKKMPRLTGTPKQRSSKFLGLRGMIRGALEAEYEPEQILAALRELRVWLPSAPAFDAALGRQDGVQAQPSPGRGGQPIFKNDQWQQHERTGDDDAPPAPSLDVFGVRTDAVA